MKWAFSDLADKWDDQRAETEQILDQFVTDHPGFLSVVGATAVSTSIELGAGMVDLLRLGEGVAEGGVEGYAKDGLRLIGILPWIGTVGRQAQRGRIAVKTLARRPMVHQALTSLRRSRRPAMVKLRELLRRSGTAGPSRYDTRRILHKLQEWKLVQPFKGPLPKKSTAFQQILYTTSVGENLGKILFSIPKSGAQLYTDVFGNRYSADEIQRVTAVYQNRGICWVQNEPCIELRATVNEPEIAEQSFAARKLGARRQCLGGTQYTVRHGDWLSKIARSAYGDMRKWPIIYQANRETIGNNPNRIRPGQRLWVPDVKRLRLG